MSDKMYNLTLIGSLDGTASHNSVAEMVASGDIEGFIVNFINGLVHQGFHQTGNKRPVGETTMVRVANDLFLFAKQLGGIDRELDIARVVDGVDLERYANHP